VVYIPTIVTGTSKHIQQKIKIYPIPFKNQLNIEGIDIKQASLFDTNGKELEIYRNLNTFYLNNEIPNGIYYLRITDNQEKIHILKISN
jgi:hypothetical protein